MGQHRSSCITGQTASLSAWVRLHLRSLRICLHGYGETHRGLPVQLALYSVGYRSGLTTLCESEDDHLRGHTRCTVTNRH